ncbi:hypothetical protein KXR53_16885 [Inquilinus limosus]|uniref:hypothetical protein n=1 Tax=Inquilinus limosus TaxID=171674 RepID=UPI003F149088
MAQDTLAEPPSPRRGRGIALANPFLAADDLAAGRLVAIGSFAPVSLGAYLFSAPAECWNAAPVARFRRWLLRMVAEEADTDMGVTTPGESQSAASARG